MSLKTVQKIKEQIRKECYKDGHIEPWFYDVHLLAVERQVNFLLKKLPKANKEVVLLAVWLHDSQRIRGIKGHHSKIGAKQAARIMKEFGYEEKIIKEVQEVIISHSCDSKDMPKTLEAKILASADAMSHYQNNFYLHIAVSGYRNLEEFKKFGLKKLKRDYNKKIFFPFAKKAIKERHDILMKLFTMN